MKLLSLLHPAYILRDQYALEPAQRRALKRLARDLTDPKPCIDTTQPPLDSTLFPTCAEVVAYIDRLLADDAAVHIDLETAGPVLRCVGLCRLDDLRPFVVWQHYRSGLPAWNDHDGPIVHDALCRLFASRTPKWFHNGQQFDVLEIEAFGFPFHVEGYERGGDTLLMQRHAYAEAPASLQYCAITYLGIPAWKHLIIEDEERDQSVAERWLDLDDTTLATYNCWDTYAGACLPAALTQILERNGQIDYYRREVWPQIRAVLHIQKRGLPYDSDARTRYRRKLRAELRETDEALRQHFTETANLDLLKAACAWQLLAWLFPGLPGWGKVPPSKVLKSGKVKSRPAPFTKGEWDTLSRRSPWGFNPNSDDQLRQWLFDDLGLKPSTRTDKGKPSVNMDALNRILQRLRRKDEHAIPVLHRLMHRSRLAKIDADYLDPPVTEGRVYPTIKMLGTETGRFAYADPPVHSWPDEIRHLVRSES